MSVANNGTECSEGSANTAQSLSSGCKQILRDAQDDNRDE